jgi:hypothetical protein
VPPTKARPGACRVSQEAEPEDARLLKAALAWELAVGRKATAGDEGAVRDRRRQTDETTAGKESSSTKE